ncbi:class I SAM-dependent RNA methyltransferase [Acetobacter sp.]|uniref:class I SAM-dependent RNA methyltransferase n=1 Tax=Acetobacter sp. TaxID=440 RepID=UPI0039ECF769
MTTVVEAPVLYLAAQGDGAVRLPDGQVTYCAGTLAGEHVRLAQNNAGVWRLDTILQASPSRVTPPCPLSGTCGGCSLQHMQPDALLEWKVGKVRHALEKAGFSAIPEPTRYQVPPLSRRRVDLAVRRTPDAMLVGLHARGSTTVTDMSVCPVLNPDILRLLPAFRTTLRSLQAIRSTASLHINLLDSGPDIVLLTDAALQAPDRVRLARLAEEHGIPRIAWRLLKAEGEPETAAQNGPVFQTIAGHRLTPPPGAFLQATLQSEQAIQQAVMAALPDRLGRRESVIELYAGCGTLTLPLSERCRVLAYEGHAPACAALKAAGNTRIQTHCQDLNRQPVMAKDLAKTPVVVLDPPHAGSRLQMRQIAQGKPAQVIYVSCNPAALSKDAAMLADAGYRLDSVAVIDQFLWSAETETVCSFRRESSHRSRTVPSRSG